MDNLELEKIRLQLDLAISMLLTTERYKNFKREELEIMIVKSIEVIIKI